MTNPYNLFANNLLKTLPCVQTFTSHNELTCSVPSNFVLPTLLFLRDNVNCQYKVLTSITAVDFPTKERRFEVIYHFLSMTENKRCRVTTSITDVEEMPSITSVFECANWFEREIFDLFGIKFTSHPDLRRILTDYGFEGHPLRKDFPTSGFLEVRYDELEKRVVYEPTSLTQGYRDFDFLSPWDNPEVYTNMGGKDKN